MARHGGLHVTGSYTTGGKSSRCLSGVYRADIGTTVRVASILEDGQTFHDSRTPVHQEKIGSTKITHAIWLQKRTIAVLDIFKVEHDSVRAVFACGNGEPTCLSETGDKQDTTQDQ